MDPFKEGRQAARNGMRESDNPYDRMPVSDRQAEDSSRWLEGFDSHEPKQKTHKGKREWN